MATTKSVKELNRELGQRINEEALTDPESPYSGKFVGIVSGQVVIVTDDLDELGRTLEAAPGQPSDKYFLEAGRDPSEVEEIWSAV